MHSQRDRYEAEVAQLAQTPILGRWVDEQAVYRTFGALPWGEPETASPNAHVPLLRILTLAFCPDDPRSVGGFASVQKVSNAVKVRDTMVLGQSGCTRRDAETVRSSRKPSLGGCWRRHIIGGCQTEMAGTVGLVGGTPRVHRMSRPIRPGTAANPLPGSVRKPVPCARNFSQEISATLVSASRSGGRGTPVVSRKVRTP